MITAKHLTGLVILSGLISFFFIQCDNGTNKPHPYISDYDIYLRDANTEDGMFYIFNTKAMQIVDSFYLPYPAMWPTLSADGKRLYLADVTSGKTVVIDVEARELVFELEAGGYLPVVSANDKYLAVFGDSLDIFDGHSLEKLYTYPEEFTAGWFSSNENRLYCVALDGNIVKLALETPPIQASHIDYPGYSVMGCIPSSVVSQRYVGIVV